jgi:flagellar hook-associated protein 3 FlgL
MALDRVSSFSLYQSTLRDAGKVMSDLATQQNQLSSGFKSPDFSGISNDAEQFLALENRLSRNQQYMNDNRLASVRLESSSNVISQTISTANDIRNLILLRRNGSTAESIVFDENLNGYWKSLTSQLNSTVNGRYLFSGTKTDIPPVDTTSFPSSTVSGVPDSNYYLGSEQNLTLRIQDNVEITYNVRADDPAYQKIFAGLSLAKEAATGSNADIPTDDLLKQAYDLISEGLTGLNSLQAKVNSNKVLLDTTTEQQNAQQLYWKGIKEELINTDLLSVSTQVAVNQGILTAAFQSFAKINSLRLSDFLR